MKKLLAIICALSMLLLCACSDQTVQPTQTDPTHLPSDTAIPQETYSMPGSTAFDYFPESTQSSNSNKTLLGVVLNEPFDSDEPQATVTWSEGEYERAYIIPAFVGSRVALYELNWDENGNCTRPEEPTYCVESSPDGCVIAAVLTRPEGYPMYYLEITDINGESFGYELTYNGNTGTPPIEYLYED